MQKSSVSVTVEKVQLHSHGTGAGEAIIRYFYHISIAKNRHKQPNSVEWSNVKLTMMCTNEMDYVNYEIFKSL